MKALKTILFIILLAAAGSAIGILFNSSMGISVGPRDTMPADPEILKEKPEHLEHHVPWVMFDPGAVGIDADTAAWITGDYDHELRRFTSLYRPAPVYLDSAAFREVREQWQDYLRMVASWGGTAIEFKMMLDFIDFDLLGNGTEVYSEDHEMRKRQEVYRDHFGLLFSDVDSFGLGLFLSSDMVVLTRELEEYILKQPHGMNTADPEFWKIYQAGISEIFQHFPFIDGIQIRVGEAGSFYNRPNWPYRSELWVDDISEVRAMLRALQATCKEHDKVLSFRSWTVGKGSVGDLHTDTAMYAEVFRGLDDSNLWVSTKWVEGDFYPFTPYNPTLSVGSHKRIIEFQARREYEAFSAYPLWIVPYEQYALQTALMDNPNIHGFWIWTMNGGPIRRSAMSLIPHTGDLTWIEMNARGSAALASDPYLDTDSLLQAYITEYFQPDSAGLDFLSRLLKESHNISRSGLAFPTAVQSKIRGLGSDVPPGIYTYWDLVLASSAVNAILYHVGSDDYEQLIGDIQYPVRALEGYLSELDSLDSQIDSAKYQLLVESLSYEYNLFKALAGHKTWLMQHYQYLHKGGKERKEAYLESARTLEELVSLHQGAYSDRLDYRAYNFPDAMQEVRNSTKADKVEVLRWILLAIALIVFLYLLFGVRRFSSIWIGPIFYVLIMAGGKFDALSPAWALLLILASVAYVLLTSIFYKKKREGNTNWHRSWTMLIALSMLSLIMSAWRGPMNFGFWFWTSPGFRIILFALAFTLIGLHINYMIRALKRFGSWLLSLSFWLLVLAIGFGAFWTDLDERITLFNAEAALLPNSIVHTWGFVGQFGLPPTIAEWTAGIAAGLIILILIFRRK